MSLEVEIKTVGEQAKKASRELAKLSTTQKNQILLAMADELEASRADIQKANAKDLEAGKASGLSDALLDRLLLTDKRLDVMIGGLREVVELPDPVGLELNSRNHANGMKISKVRTPIGVIGIIYESRPNVTADASSLCLKAGNAVILRGGKEALHSNNAIFDAMARGGKKAGLPDNALQLIQTIDREAVRILVQLQGLVDLIIPRGGEGLIKAVSEMAHVPVIKHYKGVCHTFVDESADLEMAEKISIDAKCDRPGVCNSMETLLVHEAIAKTFLPKVITSLQERKVEIRGDSLTKEIIPEIIAATEEDWYAEYLDLILAVRVVSDVDAAIEHINKYGSYHSDAIVTENKTSKDKFLNEVDSATVYVNASTRFTDGAEFGLGAEIGISTDKLHARGPMGLEELTTYKFVITGEGQVRGG